MWLKAKESTPIKWISPGVRVIRRLSKVTERATSWVAVLLASVLVYDIMERGGLGG